MDSRSLNSEVAQWSDPEGDWGTAFAQAVTCGLDGSANNPGTLEHVDGRATEAPWATKPTVAPSAIPLKRSAAPSSLHISPVLCLSGWEVSPWDSCTH